MKAVASALMVVIVLVTCSHFSLPSKRTTFVQCWFNVEDVGRRCNNDTQMFCVCWVFNMYILYMACIFYVHNIALECLINTKLKCHILCLRLHHLGGNDLKAGDIGIRWSVNSPGFRSVYPLACIHCHS